MDFPLAKWFAQLQKPTSSDMVYCQKALSLRHTTWGDSTSKSLVFSSRVFPTHSKKLPKQQIPWIPLTVFKLLGKGNGKREGNSLYLKLEEGKKKKRRKTNCPSCYGGKGYIILCSNYKKPEIWVLLKPCFMLVTIVFLRKVPAPILNSVMFRFCFTVVWLHHWEQRFAALLFEPMRLSLFGKVVRVSSHSHSWRWR